MSQIVTVYNFKGGVGKTTTSYNLACAWSRKFRVLVIDCDPQCNLTYVFLGNHKEKVDIFQYISSYIHNRTLTIAPVEINPYLHVIPGSYRMVDLESNSQFIEFGLSILQKFFQHISPKYDFILIDCPSYFGKTVKFLIGNANGLLIPATPDSFSLRGVVKLLKHIKTLDRVKTLHILGVFFNRYRSNLLHHKKVKVIAKRILGPILIDKTIRNTVRASEAVDKGYANGYVEPETPVTQDFYKLSEILIEKLHSASVSKLSFKSME